MSVARYCNWNTGWTTALSRERIAEHAGLQLRATANALALLKRRGYLLTRRAGRATAYAVQWTPQLDLCTEVHTNAREPVQSDAPNLCTEVHTNVPNRAPGCTPIRVELIDREREEPTSMISSETVQRAYTETRERHKVAPRPGECEDPESCRTIAGFINATSQTTEQQIAQVEAVIGKAFADYDYGHALKSGKVTEPKAKQNLSWFAAPKFPSIQILASPKVWNETFDIWARERDPATVAAAGGRRKFEEALLRQEEERRAAEESEERGRERYRNNLERLERLRKSDPEGFAAADEAVQEQMKKCLGPLRHKTTKLGDANWVRLMTARLDPEWQREDT